MRIAQFLTQQKLPSTGNFSKNLIIDIDDSEDSIENTERDKNFLRSEKKKTKPKIGKKKEGEEKNKLTEI